MKFLCILFSIFFITFLSTPTVICLIDNQVDTKCFYNLCEEEKENNVCFDEIKSVTSSDFDLNNLFFYFTNSSNNSIEANLSFINLTNQIFSPPPDSV
jgi:hypothetical protein